MGTESNKALTGYCLFVGYDAADNGDEPIMVVGHPDPKTHEVEIFNLFKGEEATDLFKTLTTVREENK